jgi:hypothetical protein
VEGIDWGVECLLEGLSPVCLSWEDQIAASILKASLKILLLFKSLFSMENNNSLWDEYICSVFTGLECR